MPDCFLLTVPEESFKDKILGGTVVRPALPDELRTGQGPLLWGSASSKGAVKGSCLIWHRGLEADLVAFAEKTPGVVIHGRALAAKDFDPILTALGTQPPDWLAKQQAQAEYKLLVPGSDAAKAKLDEIAVLADSVIAFPKSPLQDLVSALKPIVETREQARVAADVADLAAKIVPLLLLGAPLHVMLNLFAGHPGIWALNQLAADNFNRSDRDIYGDTISSGTYVWTTYDSSGTPTSGRVNISSQQCVGTSATDADINVSNQADARSTLTLVGSPVVAFGGARLSVKTGYYAGVLMGGSAIYKEDPANTFNDLGSTGTTESAGDIVGVDCTNGTTITGLKNGSIVDTATGQSTFTTGQVGFRIATGTMDDWLAEIPAGGGGGNPWYYYQQQGGC